MTSIRTAILVFVCCTAACGSGSNSGTPDAADFDGGLVFPGAGYPGQGLAYKNQLHIDHIDSVKEVVDCKDCHKYRPGETSRHRCLRCHKDNASALHANVKNDEARECLSCHDFIHLPGATYQVWDCLNCHSGEDAAGPTRIADAPKVIVHAKEKCADCHRPHEVPATVPKDCIDCHEDNPTRHGRNKQSRPTAQVCRDCHTLHNPMDSAQAKCAGCHREKQPRIPSTAIFEGHDRCVVCHVPHDFSKATVKSCTSCHDDQKTLGATAAKEHRTCISCHLPHSPKVQRSACVDCHRTIKRTHPPDKKEGTCLGCHPIHGRRGIGFVQKVVACTMCHSKAKKGVTSFHAGGTKCDDCHKMHKQDPPKTSGSFCLGCHQKKQKDAQAIVSGKGHTDCAKCHGQAGHEPTAKRPSCGSCHEEQKKLVAQGRTQGHQKCADCHDTHRPKDSKKSACARCHADQAKSLTKGHDKCGQCHDTHSAKLKPKATCNECHKDKLVGPHVKIEKSCANCHRKHGPGGVAKPPSCESCHKPAKLPGMHLVKRHNKCTDCHKSHQDKPPADRKACLGPCHENQANHEPDAKLCTGCHGFRADGGG